MYSISREILMRRIPALLFVASWPLVGYAGEFVVPAHRCDGCNADAARQMALQQGRGVHYVHGMSSGEIRKFQVDLRCAVTTEGDPYIRHGCALPVSVARDVPVEPAIAAFHRDLVQAFSRFDGNLHLREDVPVHTLVAALIESDRPLPELAHDDIDAYTFVEHSATRNRLLDGVWPLLGKQPHARTLALLTGHAVWVGGQRIDFGLQDQTGLQVRLLFADGSRVDVDIDAPGDARYRFGSAVDSAGAPVPDPSHDPVTGTNADSGYLAGIHRVADPERWCRMVASLSGIDCVEEGAGNRFDCARHLDRFSCIRH